MSTVHNLSLGTIIAGCIYVTCVIIDLIILVISVQQINSRSAPVQIYIKIVYFLTIIFGILHGIALFARRALIFMDFNAETTGYLIHGFYSGIILFISATLFLRLYYTFRNSMFELHQYQIWIIIIASLTLLICAVVPAIIGSISNLYLLFMACFVVGFIDYFGSSIYAMVLFARKMYALSRMRAISLNKNNHGEDSVEFNAQQRELLYATTKYVTLLSLALISSWVTWIVFTINNVIFDDLVSVSGISGVIDVTVNVICLYLQFPFAAEYYNRCCICFSDCCLHLLQKQANAQLRKSKNIAIHVLDTSSTIQEKDKDAAPNISQKVPLETENVAFNVQDGKASEMIDEFQIPEADIACRQTTMESTAL